MQQTIDFLRRILPDEGYYCATGVQKNGPKYNRFYRTVEELSAAILGFDRQGLTIYHACATYVTAAHDPKGTPRSKRVLGRTAANAKGARCFWLDIDAGVEKPYATAIEAAKAVKDFCAKAQLPPPLYVSSGYGLHIYWPLEHILEPVSWTEMAQGLRCLCERHGLQADHTRTCDIASILRTPGTHNRKSGTPIPVFAGPLVGPYAIELFGALKNVETPAITHTPTTGLAARLGNVHLVEPSASTRVADNCRQLGAMRECRGKLPEPLWHACLGVLAHCEDGEQYGHEWSTGDERYSYQETQEKITRQASFGPTTCQRFHAINPKPCEACPHFGKITSPIYLGRNRQVSQATSNNDTGTFRFGPEQTNGEGTLPKLPENFSWSNGSLTFETSTKDGPVRTLISHHPLYLDSVQTGETRGEFNVIFKQRLPHQGWFDISIPVQTLFSSNGLSSIQGMGAVVDDGNLFMKYTKAAMNDFHQQRASQVRYDQFGWKDDDRAFLYGLRLYRQDHAEPVVGSDELQVRSRDGRIGPTAKGSLAAWREAINVLFAQGFEPHSVAIVASFAAPLMKFQDRQEGGCIIHLVSRESGTGKTTAAIGAASVWGEVKYLGLSERDTSVSKGLTMAALGNLPIIYDEIPARDPEAVRNFVMGFSDGRDKMRATRGGEINHKEASWQTLLISNANQSLVDVLSAHNESEGPRFRVLEFRVEQNSDMRATVGDRARNVLRNNAGHAGDAYIRWVVANIDWVKGALERYTEAAWQRIGTHNTSHRFWVRTIGAVTVAGLIVKHLGIIDFSVQRIVDYLVKHVMASENTTKITAETMAEKLGEFLDEHNPNTLVMPCPFQPGKVNPPRPVLEPKGKLIVRSEVIGNKYYIAYTPLRLWMLKHGVHWGEFCELLMKEGVILTKKKLMTLGAGTDYASARQSCTEINSMHELIRGYQPVPTDNVVPLEGKR